jgi:hypothetical protein
LLRILDGDIHIGGFRCGEMQVSDQLLKLRLAPEIGQNQVCADTDELRSMLQIIFAK